METLLDDAPFFLYLTLGIGSSLAFFNEGSDVLAEYQVTTEAGIKKFLLSILANIILIVVFFLVTFTGPLLLSMLLTKRLLAEDK